LAERGRTRGELLLQVALDAVLLERRRLPHVVRDVAQELGHSDLELVFRLAGAFAHDDAISTLVHDGRRCHPVERFVTAGVVVDQDRTVSFKHQEPNGLRQLGG